jgi:hypothetical protein
VIPTLDEERFVAPAVGLRCRLLDLPFGDQAI